MNHIFDRRGISSRNLISNLVKFIFRTLLFKIPKKREYFKEIFYQLYKTSLLLLHAFPVFLIHARETLEISMFFQEVDMLFIDGR